MLEYALTEEKGLSIMLKIVVYDSGFGGELFADKLEEELAVVETIRVIDWRNAEAILSSKKTARKAAETSLRPYINEVDLIVFANHLLTLSSLKYFRKKYKKQAFIGLDLVHPATFMNRKTLILTTKALARNVKFRKFIAYLKRDAKVISLDTWPAKIDDGELTLSEIKALRDKLLLTNHFRPEEIILACSQFNDIKADLRQVFGPNTKIHDSFTEAFYNICKTLKIRAYHKHQ